MQKLSTVIAMFVVMNSANAGDDAVKRCRQIADPAQRLACYDGIALVASTVAAVAPAPAAAPASASSAQEFGLTKKVPAAEFNVIESQTAAPIDSWNSGQIIALANGQKWRIIDDGSGFLGKLIVREVKVRRGSISNFFMEFEGVNKSPRVKRIE